MRVELVGIQPGGRAGQAGAELVGEYAVAQCLRLAKGAGVVEILGL